LRKVANRQTDKQTNNDENMTSLAEVKIINQPTSVRNTVRRKNADRVSKLFRNSDACPV